MNRDEKELMIHDLTEQLAVEKEICKMKEVQIELLKLQRNLAMAALKQSGMYTVNEIAELLSMNKAEVFDILVNY